MTTLALKAFKHYPKLSDETNAFTATLYVDGMKTAYCNDDGKGGCIDFQIWNMEKFAEAEAWAKAQPAITYTEYNLTVESTLEIVIGDLVDDNLRRWEKKAEEKWLKRQCANQTLFRLLTDPEDEWRTVIHPFNARMKAWLTQKYGDRIMIGNELIGQEA